jgi:hypothetical protein
MCVPRDDVVEQNQTRKDAKGVKRKRGHECGVLREGVYSTITFGYTHAYAHERETVRM